MECLFLGVGTYAIACDETGQAYVGWTDLQSFRRRWDQHIYLLNKGIHHCRSLQSLWIQYGALGFSFQILEPLPLPGGEFTGFWGERGWIDELERHQMCLNVKKRRKCGR